MLEKFKLFINDDVVFMAILICLVGLGSFILGQQSMVAVGGFKGNKVTLVTNSGIPTDYSKSFKDGTQLGTELVSDVESMDLASEAKYVASKSGSKYHLLNCPGAQQIKEKNKIYFNSITEAESAGYTPASNCPGL